MYSHIILGSLLLLAGSTSLEEPPRACLLQRSSSELQRTVLAKETKQEPNGDIEAASNNNEAASNNNEAASNDNEAASSSNENAGGTENVASNSNEDTGTTGSPKVNIGGNDNAASNSNEGASSSNENAGDKEKNANNDNEAASSSNENAGGNDINKAASNSNEEEGEWKAGEKKNAKEEKKTGHDESTGGSGKSDDNSEQQQGDDFTLDSLRMELRLAVSLADIKKSKTSDEPMPEFLDHLKKEFAKAAGIELHRLEILGIRGAFEEAEKEDTSLAQTQSNFHETHIKSLLQEGPILAELQGKIGEENHAIVDIEILPGTLPADLSPRGVFSVLEEKLANEDSHLRKGSLKDVLKGAKLKPREGAGGVLPHDAKGSASRQGMWLATVALALSCL